MPVAAEMSDLGHKVTTDDKGNTVFTLVLDQLPLSENEVFDTALNYLQSEYKTTRYNDIQQFRDKGIVVGKGNLNSFYTDSGLAKSEVFSTEFYLRIDSKNGRARVQLIFNKYKVLELSDFTNKYAKEVVISQVAPFADAKDNKRYKKAFNHLQELALGILKSVSLKVKTATPAPAADDW